MKIEIKDIDKDFIDIIKNIKTEDTIIDQDKIIIEGNSISKIRAKINLIMRLLYIYNSLNNIFKDDNRL